MAPAMAPDAPRDPRQTLRSQVVAAQLETLLASLDAAPDARGLPASVERACSDSLPCGVLAHGLLRLGCATGHQELRLACSCQRRGVCPSCAGAKRVASATCEQRRWPRPPPTEWSA